MSKLIIPMILVACGGSKPAAQPPGSRGPRASEHLSAARDHDQQAKERAMWPDTRPPDGAGRVDQLLVATPWTRTWDTAAEHERMAAIHRGAAGTLHAEYADACGQHALSEVAVSPLARYGVGGAATAEGATVFLSPDAGPADRLIADLKCHRAWMMLAPANMDACPLDLAGLQVAAQGTKEGITVTLTVRDPALVPELQRRIAAELEAHPVAR